MEEIDDLFQRAAQSFVRCELDLARVAYWRLLHVFLDDHEAFGDAETPEDLVETDLREATAFNLRALYETLPLDQRAPRLLEELRQIEYVGGLVTLADIAGTKPEALPDLEAFLPSRAPRDWLRYRGRSLLVEAARLHRGSDGLADLARASVAGLPQLMLDWVDALEADCREDDAMAACREGLEGVDAGGVADEVRAQLADRLAVLGGRRGLTDVALEARRTAWRSEPSQRRLLELVAAADTLGVTREVIEAEADHPGRCGSPRLVCAVLLLAGKGRAGDHPAAACQAAGVEPLRPPGPGCRPLPPACRGGPRRASDALRLDPRAAVSRDGRAAAHRPRPRVRRADGPRREHDAWRSPAARGAAGHPRDGPRPARPRWRAVVHGRACPRSSDGQRPWSRASIAAPMAGWPRSWSPPPRRSCCEAARAPT